MFPQYQNDLINALRAVSHEEVYRAYNVLSQARARNAAVYILGNGGSAATASHFANDLFKMCGIRAFSLADMTPTFLAYGNDLGWKTAYASMLKGLLAPQDVVVVISCSGNSPNIVSAMQFVNSIEREQLPGIKTIALLGADPHSSVDRLFPSVAIHVPFRDIRVQEDCHLVICHSIVGELSGKAESPV
jgi:D-sedoheptulose 7-phosphate isomerase